MNVLDVETNEAIVDALREKNNLYASWQYKNEYFISNAHDERILLRSAPSWFVRVPDKLKQACLEELSIVKFIPPLPILSKKPEVEQKYINIVEELATFEEWCISDDINWGIPVPHFKNEQGEILMDPEIVEHFASLVEQHGGDIWHTASVEELLPLRYKD